MRNALLANAHCFTPIYPPPPPAAGSEPIAIDAPPAFVFHHANAFQTRREGGATLVTL